MLCRKFDSTSEKVSYGEEMQTKTLYNLHIHIDAEDKKDAFSRLRLYCTPACIQLLRQDMFPTYF